MTIKRLQSQVTRWLHVAFGYEIANDKVERSYRFLEESLELFQSSGRTREEAERLVDYVYGRPVGEIEQEVGGVFLTLAAFCHAHGIDFESAANEEHKRAWRLIDQIRKKQQDKPRMLGGKSYPERNDPSTCCASPDECIHA